MDAEIIKVLADVGLGGLSLILLARHGKILANHEERITVLEAVAQRKRKRKKAKCP